MTTIWTVLPPLLACGMLGCASTAQPLQDVPAFYTASPQELAGPPGSLIRTEPMNGAPLGATAFRMLYRSTGLHGEPIAVSGVLVVPPGDVPASGRKVVAWAHPTSGVVPRCAPSRALFVFQQMMGLRDMIEHGYVVAATDYPGLGTAGPHPYLVGSSEGRAVLDSVRAAGSFAQAGAGDKFAVWGHSQGGHAALHAGLLAASYAPELHLAGIAAAAPATEIGTLLADDFDSEAGRNLTAMTLWSWSCVFGAPLAPVVEPAAIPVVDLLAAECIEAPLDLWIRQRTARPLERAFLSVQNIATVEPWRSLLAANTPSALPPSLPVFLIQGTDDRIVLPAVTADYMRRLCQAGSQVRMLILPGVGHGFTAMHGAIPAIDWIADRFQGRAAPSDCPS